MLKKLVALTLVMGLCVFTIGCSGDDTTDDSGTDDTNGTDDTGDE